MPRAIFWNVYRAGELIDSVPYDRGCEADYVRRSLIEHDGYPDDIEVRPDIPPGEGDAERITINGRSFTLDRFAELLDACQRESVQQAARRLAQAFGVGCVTS